jgi:hypothetical protein
MILKKSWSPKSKSEQNDYVNNSKPTYDAQNKSDDLTQKKLLHSNLISNGTPW